MSIDIIVTVPASWVAKFFSSLYNNFYGRITGHSFIFDRYTKQLIIFQNGHGILIHNFIIRILRRDKFDHITRFISINDACKDTSFLKFNKLLSTDLSDRYQKMGFWYEPRGLISRINRLLDDESKELKWEFVFDNAQIRESKIKTISLSYAFSIPCMFPITNGYFDPTKSPQENYNYHSSLTVRHKIKKLRYIISFDKMISLSQKPEFEIFPRGPDHYSRNIFRKDISDIIYNTYISVVRKPRVGAKIQAKWLIESQ